MYEIVMAEPAWERFWEYVDICPGEVGAFGYCSPNEEGFVYVDDLCLVPQEVTAGSVDFIEHGLPYAMKKAIEDERVNDLRFCIHSHATFGADWSATDEDMIEKIGSTGTPWFASVIFNKARKTAGRVDLFTPALKHQLPGMKQATVDALVVSEARAELRDACLLEVEEFVKKPKAKPKKLLPPGKGKGKPNGQPQGDTPPPLNMGDLIEYDDDFVLDTTSGTVYKVDNHGRLRMATLKEEDEFWHSPSDAGAASASDWYEQAWGEAV